MCEELPDSIVLIPAGALLCIIGEIERLKVEVESRDRRIANLEARQNQDCERFSRDIAFDRQRISKLENPNQREPTTTELSHLQKIEKHLKASPWHSASFAEIRGLLGVSPGRVSQLVKRLDPNRFEVKRSAGNHKARVLVLKGRLLL